MTRNYITFGLCLLGLVSPNISFASEFKTSDFSDKTVGKYATPPHSGDDVQAGYYLASRFAQNRHDWNEAARFLEPIIADTPNDQVLLQRYMVLSIGSGHVDEAIKTAKKFKALYPKEHNSITQILLISDAIKRNSFKEAEELYKNLKVDRATQFVAPFLEGWIHAGQGKLRIKRLKSNIVQLYHAILISDYLKDYSAIEKMVDRAVRLDGVNFAEIEKIADLYAHIGLTDQAVELYELILERTPTSVAVQNKLDHVKAGTNQPVFSKVQDAKHGMAKALHDISDILHSEHNDQSARVFAYIALHLDPEITKTRFLLGKIHTAQEQYDEAIGYYKTIPKNDENHLQAQHKIVSIYEQQENYSKAYSYLKALYKEHGEIETVIKMGDVFRYQGKYNEAMTFYNTAISHFGEDAVPDEFWYLYYVRGISYEQTDRWNKAETDLQKALQYQPDHPYVLNYLGYAWADRGENLDQAMEMIKRAVELRPSDGYITDSLGWVLYKVEDYHSAVPVLERAVELRPHDPTINDHLGDAYWKVGRKMEARFQWERAKNHSDDAEQIETIEKKLISGLPDEKITAIEH